MAGRGRKRRRECENGKAAAKNYHPQSHNNNTVHHQSSQDYPFSPPLCSRGVVLTSPPFSKKPFGSPSIKTPDNSKPILIITLDEDDELHHHEKAKETSVEVISEIPGSSPINGAFEYVDGHWVKTESAPLLRAIFDKYGNITKDTDVKSPYHLSIFLERLCHVYQRLECVDLTRAELQGITSELRLLEARKISVGWILERVENISQSFQDCQRAARFDALEKDLEEYERQVCLLQQKISSTKAELLMHKPKNDQVKEGGGDMDI
ncbi:uncharacterized protein LOC130998103 [Salvia miltiorrhiza]|uniref:uncharacterized protein LOC130998103 n=1 Tax=Salvia miltiorrhiza TaxID=226208 RepID=UPI0025ACC5BA|nr:uncharacterized protein LOC130998103 [Salvia miltiorrhiza]